jgi:hypothetical protein
LQRKREEEEARARQQRIDEERRRKMEDEAARAKPAMLTRPAMEKSPEPTIPSAVPRLPSKVSFT